MKERIFIQYSASLQEHRIMLNRGDRYVMHAPNESIEIIAGSAVVYEVKWTQNVPGQPDTVLEKVVAGMPKRITSLLYTDEQGQAWRRMLVAQTDGTVLCRCDEKSHQTNTATQSTADDEPVLHSASKSPVDHVPNPSQTKKLQSGQSYYSQDADDAWYVSHGAVNVYVVPLDRNGKPLRKEFLRQSNESDGSVIPGFRCCLENITYCLEISAQSPSATLTKSKCTKLGRDRFLENSDAWFFITEGFDRALVEFYKKYNDLANQVKQASDLAGENDIERQKGNAFQNGLDMKSNAPVEKGGSQVYRAMAYICEKGNISILSQDDLMRICHQKQLEPMDIARASHFICRNVTLEDKWWHSDCGLLLCFKDGVTVACVPRSAGKYTYFDTQTGQEKPLTPTIAQSIDPQAYSIRRSLPLTPLTQKDVIAFVKQSIYRKDIGWLIGIGLLCMTVSLLLPYLNQKIYDDYIPMGDIGMVQQMCLVIGTFMLGNIFFSLVKKLFELRITTKAGNELQDAVYHRVFELKESFIRDFDSGDLAQRLQNVGNITSSLVGKLIVTGISIAFALLYVFQMISYAKDLTLISIVMLCIYAILIFVISSAATRHETVKTESSNKAVAKLYQYIEGVEKIKMAGAENRISLDYIKQISMTHRASILSNRISSVGDVLDNAGPTIFNMILYFMIAQNKSTLTVGNFIAFNTAFGALCAAVMGLVQAAVDYQYARPTIDLMKPILEATPEIKDKDLLGQMDALSGEVCLNHISFSYKESVSSVIRGLSLHIQPGEYVGIVGPSGCGKSTMLKLLLGFETPQEGEITYDGIDLQKMNLRALRKQLGVVLQNGSLIAGSIYENITITMENPSRSVAQNVIEIVGLKEDIANMPMGIDTVINESAGTISGGQKQRILIARAIAGKPKILLFDEATSALDNITQAKVCESLDQMNVTRVVIAHRLSTIRNCDRIVVMDRGIIVQQGSFEELFAQKGLFQEMAKRQMAGYEEDDES